MKINSVYFQGIYISKIIPGGAAAATSKLRMGDRVLAVNATDIRLVTHQEAVMALLQTCDVMKLKVQHDPLPPGFKEILVVKEPGEKLGMIIKGGLRGQPGNPLDSADEGVFCVKVNPGSRASKDSGICVGQRIIEVNGQSLLGATHQEAVAILRNAGDEITLLVCDGFNPALVPTVPVPAITAPPLSPILQPQAVEELNSTGSSAASEPADQTVIINSSLPEPMVSGPLLLTTNRQQELHASPSSPVTPPVNQLQQYVSTITISHANTFAA